MSHRLDTIDLRYEMDKLIDQSGHWIVMRQSVPGRVCACVDPITKDSNPDCNQCLGSGRAFIDRFTKARKSRPVKITQTLGGESRAPIMEAGAPDWIFYIEWFTRPTHDDFVLELKLGLSDIEPIQPFSIVSVYNITDVRDLRDIGGRVEYYAITGKRLPWPYFEIAE